MSANEYARQRGRDPLPEAAGSQRPVKRALPPLTAAEQARVAETRDAVRTLMPELVPEIKDLHELGMIDGWRDVSIEPIQPNTGSQA